MPSLQSIYIGPTPPSVPTGTYDALWLSTAFRDMRPSSIVGDRSVAIAPSLTIEGGVCQEPNMFWNPNANRWQWIYTGGWGTSGILYAESDTVAGPVRKGSHGFIIGAGSANYNGSTIYASGAYHGGLYIEGNTAYMFFVNQGVDGPTSSAANTIMRCATASLSSDLSLPASWNIQPTIAFTYSSSYSLGNISVLKMGANQYVAFIEASTGGWQQLIAYATSPAGPYTFVDSPIKSLQPQMFASGVMAPGGPNLYQESDGSLTIFYHVGDINGGVPTEGYVATCNGQDLTTWTIGMGGKPFLARAASDERDQVADLYVIQDPAGNPTHVAYSAMDNTTPQGLVKVVPLLPMLRRWNGTEWVQASSAGDTLARPRLDYYGNHTANSGVLYNEDAAFDTNSGALTGTLPKAVRGARCRVQAVSSGATYTNAVTVAVTSGDAIFSSGSTVTSLSLSVGQTATMECYIPGKWSRIS